MTLTDIPEEPFSIQQKLGVQFKDTEGGCPDYDEKSGVEFSKTLSFRDKEGKLLDSATSSFILL